MSNFLSIPKNYWQQFPDVSFSNWKVEGNDIWNLHTPNKLKVSIDPSRADFDDPQIVGNVSTKMWVYSLGFLSQVDSIEVIEKVLSQFMGRFRRSDELYRISSWDHCAAVRINSMLFLLSRFARTPVSILALEVLRDATARISIDILAKNNHGMMLAFSGIKAASLGALEPSESKRVSNVCFSFIKVFLSETFDKYGWCNENTPGYQDFFRKYLAGAVKFLDAHGQDDDFRTSVQVAHYKSEEALYKVVLPNGNIPPIGESGAYPTRFPSTNGIHEFLESGLLVSKTENSYFSVVSGRRSETHKQMDDTSITLWAEGSYLILDSGLYTYDREDERSRALNSQRGHSGLFLRRFDGYRRPEFVKKYPKYRASIKRKNYKGVEIVKCSCTVPELNLHWTRMISIHNESSISLLDKVKADATPNDVVQRFVIPNEAEVVFDREQILVRNDDVCLRLLVRGSFRHAVKVAKSGPEAIGWRSKSFGHIEPAQVVEIYPATLESKIDLRVERNRT